jgi:DoxX-like family
MNNKNTKVIFWVTTGIIFLFEGVMPALTSQSEMGKAGISHLGYPAYFGVMLAVFKVSGALALIVPQVPSRVKEWAYAGFSFSLISAFISNVAVDGVQAMAFFPLVILGILAGSYFSYHQLMD